MDKSCKKILKKVVGHLKDDQKNYRGEIEDDEELKKEVKSRTRRLKGAKGVKESEKMSSYGRDKRKR